jgi:hypothetical protein
MKKIFGVAVLLAALAAATTTPAHAQSACSSGELMKFGQNGFAYEPAYNTTTHISTAGNILSIVGHIDYFCGPMAGLNPADPTKEYTFYITGLVSQGTVPGANGPTQLWDTDYTGGTWEIHEGSPENAPVDGTMPPLPDASVPATFIDGPVMLSGTLSGFHTQITQTFSIINGSFHATYQATGGLYFPQVGNGSAIFQGNWCPTMKPTGCTPATYSAHPDGKWDMPATTAVRTSTWGSIKQIYR